MLALIWVITTIGLDNIVTDHGSKTLNLTKRKRWTKKRLASLPSQPYLQAHRKLHFQYNRPRTVDILRVEKLYSKLASSKKTLGALFTVLTKLFIVLVPVPHAGVAPGAYK